MNVEIMFIPADILMEKGLAEDRMDMQAETACNAFNAYT